MKQVGQIFFVFLVLISLPLQNIVHSDFSPKMGQILYVKPGWTGSCGSWADACDLMTALYRAQPGDEVWVAAGNYTPTNTTNREISFQLKSGIAIYGGFPANGGGWNTRNWVSNVSTLSGDIPGENSYHVVRCNEVDNTGILDGFTIQYGNANGDGQNGSGGGIYNYECDPQLTNLSFWNNRATGSGGGGVYNSNSNPTITNSQFQNNYAEGNGGGLYNYNSNPTLQNVLFYKNSVDNGRGGGMYNDNYSSPQLVHGNFSENSAYFDGGGMSNNFHSSPVIIDVFFYGNYSHFNGGGMSSAISSDPILTNVEFRNNSARFDGGGFFSSNSNPKLSDVLFIGNHADNGGGLAGEAGGNISELFEVDFINNSADSCGGGIYQFTGRLEKVNFVNNYAGDSGGGLYSANRSYYPHMINGAFQGNSAGNSGGGSFIQTDMTIENVTFSENYAVNSGGGTTNSGALFHELTELKFTNVTFYNNSVANGQGGGMFNSYCEPTFLNVTFSGNSALYGGGISNDNSEPKIINSIIWGNTPDQVYNNLGSALITYSCVQYGYTGEGNINSDPLLQDLGDNGGFTKTIELLGGSPAIDAGKPSICPATDQRGILRPFDGDGNGTSICDMGAYEWAKATLSLNVNGEGSVLINPEKPEYIAGEEVELIAFPQVEWLFAGWSGDLVNIQNPISFRVMGDMVVTANFASISARLFLPIISVK